MRAVQLVCGRRLPLLDRERLAESKPQPGHWIGVCPNRSRFHSLGCGWRWMVAPNGQRVLLPSPAPRMQFRVRRPAGRRYASSIVTIQVGTPRRGVRGAIRCAAARGADSAVPIRNRDPYLNGCKKTARRFSGGSSWRKTTQVPSGTKALSSLTGLVWLVWPVYPAINQISWRGS